MARRKAEGSRTLVGAAKRVKLSDKASKPAPREAWQGDAWLWFDEVPEVKELLLWRGNQLAKLRLFVATIPEGAPPDSEPVPATDPDSGVPAELATRAEDLLRRLRSRVGGQGEILRRLELNLEVVGEAYVVGFGEREEERDPETGEVTVEAEEEHWTVCSIDEVSSKEKAGTLEWTVKQSAKAKVKGRVLDNDRDDIFRVWQPHARFFEDPDCALRGILSVCETLFILSNQEKAEARSRIHAGMVAFPNSMTLATSTPGDTADAQDFEGDPLIAALIAGIVASGSDVNAESALVPFLLKGNPDDIEKIRRIELGRTPDASLDKRIEAKVLRAARGLNAPVEVVLGHQQTTFANAEQIDQDVWEDYVQPRAVLDVDAFTVGYLRPRLLEEGADQDAVERLFVWYDASDLVAQPDVVANADAAYDRFELSGAAYLRTKGFDEADAAEPLEVLVRAGLRRGIFTADISLALISLLGEPINVEPLPEPAPGEPVEEDEQASRTERTAALARLLVEAQRQTNGTGDHPQVPVRALLAAPARRGPGSAGARLAAIDRELRTRLLVATNDAMTRALEKAGNRLRGKAGTARETLRSTPPVEAAATLGPALVAQAGFTDDDLLAGAFDSLERTFRTWTGAAQGQAISVVSRLVSGLDPARREALGLRMAESLDEAWGWLHESLTSLARARLYDPSPVAAALGEFDPTLRVPPGLVRQAIARAGGATGLMTTGQGDAWVSLADGGRRPAGGVGTGELVKDVLREEGLGIEAYQWDYGAAPRMRGFEPHEQLDGVTFLGFDDEAISNGYGWPPFPSFMPGDHDGCLCDAVPIIIGDQGPQRVVPEQGVEDG